MLKMPPGAKFTESLHFYLLTFSVAHDIIYPENKRGATKVTRQEMKDYAVRNWGFENYFTIELFQMDERGESDEAMADFIEVVDFVKSI